MDSLEEKFLKIIAKHEDLLNEIRALSPSDQEESDHVSRQKIEVLTAQVRAYADRSSRLTQEIKDLYKNSPSLKFENLINSLWAWAKGGFRTSDLSQYRLSICNSCPHYKDRRCTICGCFMEAKTRLPKASCPIHKWKSSTREEKKSNKK